MKHFTKVFIAVLILIGAIFIFVNMALVSVNKSVSKQYKVDISRASIKISESGIDSLNIKDYPNIIAITPIDESGNGFLSEYYYEIRQINGELYRFDYCTENNIQKLFLILNLSLGIITLIVAAVFIYIKQQILKPFNTIIDVPLELSKGNLSVPIKEQKRRYFGKFLWGIDLLREHLEEQKSKELQLIKEKKTLVLSISHDIKTPLGIIELYAKSLEKNLYKDEKKKQEIAQSITEKCNEIKQYVSEIIEASNEDFLDFEVDVQDIYISEIINEIRKLYVEKLKLLKIEFSIEHFNDCVIFADKNRAIEVLQNIIENAVKYGDGKKIQLSFKFEDNCILVEITNSGCTLSNDEFLHIFDSFWRGSNVGSNDGSGLGLYICKKLMQAMGGEVFAKCYEEEICVTVVFRMA